MARGGEVKWIIHNVSFHVCVCIWNYGQQDVFFIYIYIIWRLWRWPNWLWNFRIHWKMPFMVYECFFLCLLPLPKSLLLQTSRMILVASLPWTDHTDLIGRISTTHVSTGYGYEHLQVQLQRNFRCVLNNFERSRMSPISFGERKKAPGQNRRGHYWKAFCLHHDVGCRFG